MIEVLYLYLVPHHFAIAKVILILLEHSKSLIVARMDESYLFVESHWRHPLCQIRYNDEAYDVSQELLQI